MSSVAYKYILFIYLIEIEFMYSKIHPFMEVTNWVVLSYSQNCSVINTTLL